MALKRSNPALRKGLSGYGVTPDEMDVYQIYDVIFPASSGNVGTTAAGTAGQAKAMVVVNKMMDYPRNLAGALAGSNDLGGTWTVNGKDQFGVSITETITVATAANGGTTDGTMVFAQIDSGTCNFATASVGNGTPTLQYVTTGTSVKFGLPYKLGGTTDIKSISWTDEFTPTVINGGTINAYSGTGGDNGYDNWFRGTEDVDGTQTYHVVVKPSYDETEDVTVANL